MTSIPFERSTADNLDELLGRIVEALNSDQDYSTRMNTRFSTLGAGVGSMLADPELPYQEVAHAIASMATLQEKIALASTEPVDARSFALGALVATKGVLYGGESAKRKHEDTLIETKEQERLNQIVIELFQANPDTFNYAKLCELFIHGYDPAQNQALHPKTAVIYYRAFKNLQDVGLIDEEQFQVLMYGHLEA